MKIKVFNYKNGGVAFGLGNIEVQLGKENPISTEELDLPEDEGQKFLDNPSKFETKKVKGKWQVKKKEL